MKRDKVDSLFSKMIRFRDRYVCQRCGAKYDASSTGLHCSHNVPRRYRRLRWTPLNALSLCYPCHAWYGGEPYESGQWLAEHLGQDRHDELMRMKREPVKVTAKTKEQIYRILKEDRAGQLSVGSDYALRDPIEQLRKDGLL